MGTIAGRVLYVGRVPPALIVVEGGGRQEVLEVNRKDRGLRFAVAYVDAERQPAPTNWESVTLDQSGWMFVPPVLAVHEGQPVRFTNGDGANHSVRSRDEVQANRFDELTENAPYTHRFKKKAAPGNPIVVTCALHSWMIAWIYVFDHSYYAVTDANGRFAMTVPGGSHRLHIRHPGGGLERDLAIDVAAGRTVPVDVTFQQRDLRLAPR